MITATEYSATVYTSKSNKNISKLGSISMDYSISRVSLGDYFRVSIIFGISYSTVAVLIFFCIVN